MKKKKCRSCKQSKTISSYYVNKSTDFVYLDCKRCHCKKMAKNHYERYSKYDKQINENKKWKQQ